MSKYKKAGAQEAAETRRQRKHRDTQSNEEERGHLVRMEMMRRAWWSLFNGRHDTVTPEHVSPGQGGQATLQASAWVFPLQRVSCCFPQSMYSPSGFCRNCQCFFSTGPRHVGTRPGQACLVCPGPDCFLEEFCLRCP